MKEYLYGALSIGVGMAAFWEYLVSPAWWIGVVVTGIAINLLSAYLKPRLDTFLGRFSSWARDRNEVRRQKREQVISLLKENPHWQLVLASRALKHRVRFLTFLLSGFALGFLAIAVSPVGPMWLACLTLAAGIGSFMLGLDDQRRAIRAESLVEEANSDLDV
jgi:hypothetical protein